MATNSAVAVAVASAVILFAAPEANAQELIGERVVPTNQTVITGYGTVGFAALTEGSNENSFTTSLSPIFLFQFQDRILFEAEFEFALTEGVTETALEYAQIDVMVTDNITLVGGKFLLPFGVFIERLHPTWINKFPTSPPIFGHHVAAFGAAPLLPIASDIGFMARGMLRPGPFHVNLNAYVTQGVSPEDPTEPIPELEFQASSSDNNTSKMVGGRIDLGFPPWVEANVSYLNGDYDDNNVLDFTGWNLAAEFHATNFELRGEYLQTRQEIEVVSGFPTLVRDGFYAQAAYRYGRWEPVLRWTQVFDSELDGVAQDQGAWQAGFGLDYWLSSSVAVMAGFELNKEDGPELDNNRFVFHIAYGF